jgi:hypothetical protein
VQMDLGMVSQELGDPLGLMRPEVVGDDVDFPLLGFERDDLAQKCHELLGGVTGGGLTKDVAAFGVERSIERERAMTLVLKAAALGPPRRERQHRVEAIERLNRGLLVDTEYRRVLRGMRRRVRSHQRL